MLLIFKIFFERGGSFENPKQIFKQVDEEIMRRS